MEFTDSARALLRRLEGFRSQAYQDEAGVWTVGFGHTGDVSPDSVLTQHQAEVVLDCDLQRFITGVAHLLEPGPQLSDLQFSALVLFSFNVGLGAFAGSTLLRDVLAGQFANVPAELLRWVHVHPAGVPVVSQVLVARREAEIALWNSTPI